MSLADVKCQRLAIAQPNTQETTHMQEKHLTKPSRPFFNNHNWAKRRKATSQQRLSRKLN
jgi:hypothetical protein